MYTYGLFFTLWATQLGHTAAFQKGKKFKTHLELEN